MKLRARDSGLPVGWVPDGLFGRMLAITACGCVAVPQHRWPC